MGLRLPNIIWHLIVPFVCLFSIPLALVAGFTTIFAFVVLVFRIASVYIDIALHIIPRYLTSRSRPPLIQPIDVTNRLYPREGLKTPSSPTASFASFSGYSTPSPAVYPPATGYAGCGYISPRRRGSGCLVFDPRHSRRSSSQVSLGSVASVAPYHEGEATNGLLPPPPVDACLTPSVGLDRDFEGVGGWRICDDDDNDWTKINSRLDLGFARPSSYYPRRLRPYTSLSCATSEAAWPPVINLRASEQRESGLGKGEPVPPNPGRVTFGPTIQLSSPPTSPDEEMDFQEAVSPKTMKKTIFTA
ncbi:hypothetical protein MMYC01_200991 [Madurella mycetomatis]|uniref:Uncharacterized protein n=1 Tax=Madurella mycetomatis TaxID=100816 RepID=A0A175WEG0_9PEZI|nr:hypothetical protein MMYC01_200991 [Madurella mycetomatis]